MWIPLFHLFLDGTVEGRLFSITGRTTNGSSKWNILAGTSETTQFSGPTARSEQNALCFPACSVPGKRAWSYVEPKNSLSPTNHCWSNLPGVSPVCWNKVSGLTHCQISSIWHFQWSTKRKLSGIYPIFLTTCDNRLGVNLTVLN